ncbi:hypothetical protein CKO25_18680 [Thiocapsa imhoffii]|uniref:DUF2126 domain-containing protein n=1 Tax=Thiocapsa imhoffii TaxID=382777 RepID=A0A9X1BBH0_9GAMM|nr:transglutaminase family protein [Thiocapsa imhoffii]MBK1646626.1 hypothetical protein [Thiocapsa imhoffii]
MLEADPNPFLSMPATIDFDQAVREHDEAVATLGLAIWVGTEPTFTDRFSERAEWLSTALGEDKAARAEQLLTVLHARAGGMILRTQGRQYPGEEHPRWSLGLYARRDGAPLWFGPPDPSCAELPALAPDLARFCLLLRQALEARGDRVRCEHDVDGRTLILSRPLHGEDPDAEPERDLARIDQALAEALEAAIESHPVAPGTAPLPGNIALFVLETCLWEGVQVARLALPDCQTVAHFLGSLDLIGAAANAAELPALILSGHPPPVDASVCWTTITPDPAVIEINMAPHCDVSGLLAASRTLYDASAQLGLAPYRLYYNGAVADSGGGGQMTFGGPSPEDSPFFRAPRLLPRLVRYLNHHPALSYLFAHDYIGGSGQAVRSDERGHDGLGELALALALLERGRLPNAETLWEGLSHLLTDAAGNSHRAELNIEKLWNPFIPCRGKLGLVEFRALRMQHSPERTAALAVLLRAIIAMLAHAPAASPAPLIDHGEALHDRYALPFYLERDLEEVLADLQNAGLGLGAPLAAMVRRNRLRELGQVVFGGCDLRIRRAIEFWPLIGDVSRQDQNTSRLVDASTMRLEICLRPVEPKAMASADDETGGVGRAADAFAGWQIAVGPPEQALALPLRLEQDHNGVAKVIGLRYRAFTPRQGLHPALKAQVPVRLILWHPARHEAIAVTLHDWRPDGEAYQGLPADLAEAETRRLARCVTASIPAPRPEQLRAPPSESLTPHTCDLRWLSVRGEADLDSSAAAA